jgi:hypothetical protein
MLDFIASRSVPANGTPQCTVDTRGARRDEEIGCLQGHPWSLLGYAESREEWEGIGGNSDALRKRVRVRKHAWRVLRGNVKYAPDDFEGFFAFC